MGRQKTLVDSTWPYHVMSRSNNRESFYLPLSQCWNIFSRYLKQGAADYETIIHTFVLMPNHFHLMLTTPRGNISAFMRFFLTQVSRGVQRAAGRDNHVFGGRFKWSWLPDAEAVAYVHKYILRNPVRAGLAPSVEAYPFSSLQRSTFPTIGPESYARTRIPRDDVELLNWLNAPTPKELENLLRYAMRRYRFAFSRDRKVERRVKQLAKVYLGNEGEK